MKKKICIVTGTRAEYGILHPLIMRIKADESFDLRIAVTGMHLSEAFGNTYREIEADGLEIDAKIEVLQNDDSNRAMSLAIGQGVQGFADYFDENRPDMVLVLGDRFEIFAATTTAAVAHIPVAHLHGGETTEGAIDEFFRHSITKMSYLHFASTDLYRRRIIQMGESPERVFNVGALSVENILNLPFLSKEELSQTIGFNLSKPYALVTFHPVTLENNTAVQQLNELLAAVGEEKSMNYIFTKANADANGRAINTRLDEYCTGKSNLVVFTSLGALKYLSAMKYCEMVIGNSSSGIGEAPILKKPTINIGDRQKGRICAASVINCEPEKEAILLSIKKAASEKFSDSIADQTNPYGAGHTSERIVAVIKDFLIEDNRIDLKKKFYDIES